LKFSTETYGDKLGQQTDIFFKVITEDYANKQRVYLPNTTKNSLNAIVHASAAVYL